MSDKTGVDSAPPKTAPIDDAQVGAQTRQVRSNYLVNKNGDAVGPTYVVPKEDFSHFLGYKTPSAEELNGKQELTGDRIIEVALQKEMNELGHHASQHGPEFESFKSWSAYEKDPGSFMHMIQNARHAMTESLDKNVTRLKNSHLGASVAPYFAELHQYHAQSQDDNYRYLEMQYQFQELSKVHDTLSNLMKTRHDAVTRTIRGSQSN